MPETEGPKKTMATRNDSTGRDKLTTIGGVVCQWSSQVTSKVH